MKTFIPYYLLPFLSIQPKTKEDEQLKLSTLNVMISLAKSDKKDIMQFFANKKFVVTIMKIIEDESKISMLVANCIMKIILSKKEILDYICQKSNLISKVKLLKIFIYLKII